MSKSRTTIKDIAHALNISTSTVSRALGDRWDVNPETRKAVLELVKKLNYRPNPNSINLKLKQSMTIGVVVPEFVNSYFAKVIMGIQNVLETKGYSILITQSGESSTTELKNLIALENRMVDGLIVSVTQETMNTDYFLELINQNFPIVFFNRVCPSITASKVVIDEYKWAFNVVEHLIEQGYKKIAHLAGPENLTLSQLRKKGYTDALKKHKISVNKDFIIPTGVLQEQGVVAARQILEMTDRPDAIFAINDSVAIGLMKTLQKSNIKIPDDIAVAGFSESQTALIIEPNLTSVEQPTYEIGQETANLLLEQIIANKNKTETAIVKTILLEAKLNLRESTLRNYQ